MGAPKNNQFWRLRSKHGRDKLFTTPELMWEAACEYFQWCDDNPFYEAEQVKQVGKPIKDKEGNYIEPERIVSLPRMRPYTIQGLCLYLDCNTQYFNDFDNSLKGKEDQMSKDFSSLIKHVKEIIYNQKFSGAAAGFFNANIIARDLGLIDKTDNKHDVSDEIKALLKPFKSKK